VSAAGAHCWTEPAIAHAVPKERSFNPLKHEPLTNIANTLAAEEQLTQI
jgi:hypothetical protein